METTPGQRTSLSPEKLKLLDLLLKKERVSLSQKRTIPQREEGTDSAPLSFAQERLFFLDQLMPNSPVYAVNSAFRLSGSLNGAALQWSLNEIVRRHEVLRTTFTMVGGQPVQNISPTLHVSLPVMDLSGLSALQCESEVHRLALDEARCLFNLSRGPLVRTILLHLHKEEHVLLLTVHHIVFDGWSMGVFLRELAELYQAHIVDESTRLLEPPIQYADFAVWQRQWLQGEVLQDELEYWKQRLAGLPTLDLPTDRRPAVQCFQGATHIFALPLTLTEGLRGLSQREEVTLFMTLLAAFQILLARYSGQEDIVVGSLIANRAPTETEELIGFFVNTLVLRTDLSGDPSVRQVVQRVRETCLGAYAHQDLPFGRLVEELVHERDLSRNPLFQVLFALQNAPMPSLELEELTLFPLEFDNGTSKFDLNLEMVETSQGLVGYLEYDTDLFDQATIRRMMGHYQTLLENIVVDPTQPISHLPILTSAELRQVLERWNDTRVDYPKQQYLHTLFEAQVEKTPEAIAMVYEGQHLSYQELQERADQLAHHLRALGVGPEVCVGLCLERSPEMLIGLFAILKAGGAFLPLDPEYPLPRLAYMIHDSQMPLLLTHAATLPVCQALLHQYLHVLVALDRTPRPGDLPISVRFANVEETAHYPCTPCTSIAPESSLAYVMYTSGSTGQPKGVFITHANAVPFFQWSQAHFAFGPEDRIVQYHSLSFDFSTWEIFEALGAGACLYLVSSAITRDVSALAEHISTEYITVLNMTPSQFDALAEYVLQVSSKALRSLRILVLGGEMLTVSLAKQAMQVLLPGCQVFNEYGPTEATISCAIFPVTHDAIVLHAARRSIPFGGPIANMQLYLLDTHLQPVPIGVSGDLYIGGIGLSRGYLNRPDITAERFIPHPFADEPGARLYKTGDLARYLSYGVIEFLGRVDHQVKLRGFRIELGEVEVVLAAHPAVHESVILVREDTLGDKRLVAYVVPAPGGLPGESELRRYLKERLPEYMVPSAFVSLETLPLTSNGKIDRRALPAPERNRPELAEGFTAPRSPAEEVVASIWADVLKRERVGIHDNFFEMGGHSLLTTQVISRVRTAFKMDIPLRELFENPTVAGFSRQLNRALSTRAGAPPSIAKATNREGIPLSFAQQRMWFLHQMLPTSSRYHIAVAFRIVGSLYTEALRWALSTIVERHESLRTYFPLQEGQPQQAIVPAGASSSISFNFRDLRAEKESEEERESEARQVLQATVTAPFDLARGPLLRATLLQMKAEEHILLLVSHHIVMDEWSIGVLFREFSVLYQTFSTNQPSPLPPLPIQYADYTCWQREWLQGQVLEKQLAYWKQQLAGAPMTLELPTDRPRPKVQTFNGSTHTFVLPPGLTKRLKALSRQEGATVFMTLLAAFHVLLFRYTGQKDILVGVPVANRTHLETEDLIGFFVNTLVLRANLDGDPSFRTLLAQLRETALETYTHQDLPFEYLVQSLEIERIMSYAPLVQVMFTFQEVPLPSLELAELSATLIEIENTTAKFDLLLFLEEREDEILGVFEYNTDLFDEKRILRAARHYQSLLEGIANNPEARLSVLPLLTEAERRQVVEEWNATYTGYPQVLCIQQIFELQAEQRPDAIAVIIGDEQVTYRELNQRANQVARYLRRLGVGPEVLVTLCVERSLEMILGILGTFKAGGAYVPLDPVYPKERLAFMLRDTQAPVLLTQQKLVERFAGHESKVVCLDTDWKTIVEESISNPAANASPDNLAYIIYTSGSTGRPKGTLVSHRGLYNLAEAQIRAFGTASDDRILQFASLSFDASIWEIAMALRTGGTLCLVTQEAQLPGPSLVRLLQEQAITIVTLPPSVLSALPAEELPELHSIITAGEVCSAELVVRWAANHRFFNAYGPTETTVCATVATCKGDGKTPPIGHPIANMQVYVLDAHLQPAPIGVPGELYIAGTGLARGYLGQPELTAERFIPSPFVGADLSHPAPIDRPVGERLYKTGDLARYLSDGAIEFLGRLDHQVKIRGFRIEPGEVEMILKRHPMIQQGAVVVNEDSPGDKRLIAFIVPSQELAPTVHEIRQFAQEQLPWYMVPTAYIFLESLPLTTSGKVDRQALKVPERMLPATAEAYVAPGTELERTLTLLWQEVLRVEQVGIHDNFFDLGGHSLLMVQIHSKLRALFDEKISMVDLFTYPTIGALASYINREGEDVTSYRESLSRAEKRREGTEQQIALRQKLRAKKRS